MCRSELPHLLLHTEARYKRTPGGGRRRPRSVRRRAKTKRLRGGHARAQRRRCILELTRRPAGRLGHHFAESPKVHVAQARNQSCRRRDVLVQLEVSAGVGRAVHAVRIHGGDVFSHKLGPLILRDSVNALAIDFEQPGQEALARVRIRLVEELACQP